MLDLGSKHVKIYNYMPEYKKENLAEYGLWMLIMSLISYCFSKYTQWARV